MKACTGMTGHLQLCQATGRDGPCSWLALVMVTSLYIWVWNPTGMLACFKNGVIQQTMLVGLT